MTIALALAAAPAAASAPAPMPAPAAQAPATDVSLPDAAEVVAAWGTLRDWVDAFDLPDPDRPESAVSVKGAGGACVILRRAGRVLGIGVATGGSPRAIRVAAGRALSSVLGDSSVSALPPELRQTVGRGLTLELEVAGAAVPLLGQSFEDVAEQLEPGLDGVAMRRGDSWAMLFPSQMLAANTAGRPERQLITLAGELGLAPASLDRLRELFGISVYRFRATHLAQMAPGRGPVEVSRGDRLVPDSEVTQDAIVALAAGLVDSLSRRRWPRKDEPVGIMGMYRPVADDHDPLIAPPFEQALCAFALARAAETQRLDPASAALAREAAHSVLHDLGIVVAGTEDDPLRHPATCAMIALAGLHGAAADAACREFTDEAEQRVLAAYSRTGGFAATAPGAPGTPAAMPSHECTVVAAALAAMLRHGSPGVDAATVRSALGAAWESVPEHQRVGLLPWLGWGELDLSAAVGEPSDRAEELRSLREILDGSRIGPGRPGPLDSVGGFALTAGDRLAATAQTVRPAAFLATMLREPSLTPPAEAALALGRHLKTVRFVIQLSVRESCSWAYRNPAQAIGGLRAATWDSDQPDAAAALGLLTALETLASLDALQGLGSGAPAAP